MRTGPRRLARVGPSCAPQMRTALASSPNCASGSSDNPEPIVLNAVMGPRGDAYRPERKIPTAEAEEYFGEQLSWLAATEVDMAFNQASEAAGWARAARAAGLPAVVSFTVET